jgi:hypothetical protein
MFQELVDSLPEIEGGGVLVVEGLCLNSPASQSSAYITCIDSSYDMPIAK